jgi:hypothetical protein
VAALGALPQFGDSALPGILQGLQDVDADVCGESVRVLVVEMPRALTNTAVLVAGARGLQSSGWRSHFAALILRAAAQQADGFKPDRPVVPPAGTDALGRDATNALRRLAPGLLNLPGSK